MAAVFRIPRHYGGSRYLEIYTMVEPPSREMNSLFVIFNQISNFYWAILTFKGSLLLLALMLKRLFARNLIGPDFTGQNMAVFWTGDPLVVNLKAPHPKCHVYQLEHNL